MWFLYCFLLFEQKEKRKHKYYWAENIYISNNLTEDFSLSPFCAERKIAFDPKKQMERKIISPTHYLRRPNKNLCKIEKSIYV